MTREEAFATLDRMAKGIAEMFGTNCETVINDLADPLSQIPSLMMAGANALSFHYEAAPMAVSRGARLIHKLGGHAGVAISPDTPVDVLFPYLASLDFVVVMSVVPGKCGQSFLSSSAKKVAALAEYRARIHGQFMIMVDGGINEVTQKMVPQADILVMGSHFFKNFNLNNTKTF